MEKTKNSRPKIYVIEDSIMTLDAWLSLLAPDCDVTGFEEPESFKKLLEEDATFLNGVDAVITDFYFEPSEITGDLLGQWIKAKNADVSVLLCSDGFSPNERVPSGVDRIIAKTPVSLKWLPIRG
jgi:hypothetical protein